MPRTFSGDAGHSQRSAVESWKRLSPRPYIVLAGDEPGLADECAALGTDYLAVRDRSEGGAPRLDAVFDAVRQRYPNQLLCYINADIITLDPFVTPLLTVARHFEEFLVVGRRIDVDLADAIDFERDDWRQPVIEKARRDGVMNDGTGSDFFAFTPNTFRAIPPFAIGRTAWDNWLMAEPLRLGFPLIDATPTITTFHQPHGYRHVSGSGAGFTDLWHLSRSHDARRNYELMGGALSVRTVLDATHELMPADDGYVVRRLSPHKRFKGTLLRFNSAVRHGGRQMLEGLIQGRRHDR